MRIVFTKHHEEVTTVKRSVTQVKVEAVGRCLQGAEALTVDITPPMDHRFPVSFKRSIPALPAHAGQLTDVVDLHKPSNKDCFNEVTYSLPESPRGNAHREPVVGEMAFRLDGNPVRRHNQTVIEFKGDEPSLIREEKLDRYLLLARRFIATQEMIELQSRSEKAVNFELVC